jgi:hypothetical protein
LPALIKATLRNQRGLFRWRFLELAFEEFLEVKEEIEGPEQGPSSVLK